MDLKFVWFPLRAWKTVKTFNNSLQGCFYLFLAVKIDFTAWYKPDTCMLQQWRFTGCVSVAEPGLFHYYEQRICAFFRSPARYCVKLWAEKWTFRSFFSFRASQLPYSSPDSNNSCAVTRRMWISTNWGTSRSLQSDLCNSFSSYVEMPAESLVPHTI